MHSSQRKTALSDPHITTHSPTQLTPQPTMHTTASPDAHSTQQLLPTPSTSQPSRGELKTLNPNFASAEEASYLAGTIDPQHSSHPGNELLDFESDTGVDVAEGSGHGDGGDVGDCGHTEGRIVLERKSLSPAKQLRSQMEDLFFMRSPGMLLWVTQIMFVENSLSMVLSVFYLVRGACGRGNCDTCGDILSANMSQRVNCLGSDCLLCVIVRQVQRS